MSFTPAQPSQDSSAEITDHNHCGDMHGEWLNVVRRRRSKNSNRDSRNMGVQHGKHDLNNKFKSLAVDVEQPKEIDESYLGVESS
ncbi:Hsp20/alpha crystallin family protein [Sesbania bispinosa]|nr:Hsp20/alpha crystallin family protein [Sesbania bispinosa]